MCKETANNEDAVDFKLLNREGPKKKESIFKFLEEAKEEKSFYRIPKQRYQNIQ